MAATNLHFSSMTKKTAAPPWSIRGVSAETRSFASRAARHAGIPLGTWVDRALREAATGKVKASRSIGPTLEETLASLTATLERQIEACDTATKSLTARMNELKRKAQTAGRFTTALRVILGKQQV